MQAGWVLCPSANHQGGSQLLAGVERGLSLELQLELRLELRLEQPPVEKLDQLPQSQHLNKMKVHNEIYIIYISFNNSTYKPIISYCANNIPIFLKVATFYLDEIPKVL